MTPDETTPGTGPGSSKQPAVVVITGPTASGKSALALAVAREFDGVVINGDSMQLYRELAVLTARPNDGQLAQAPHRLYGALPGAQACSAGAWRGLALTEIAKAHGQGRLPLVVGGTGLYLRALVRGLAATPDVPEPVREAARARHRELGGEAFHAALAARDPTMAGRLEPGDTQRLIRAWEVLEATGRSLADWQAEEPGGPSPFRVLCLALLPPRDALYETCDRRFRRMVETGALDEVRALLELRLDAALPVMKALGVPELAAHLAGQVALETAIIQAQQATRRYAKRQLTWLRRQTPRDFSDKDAAYNEICAQFSESLLGKIFPNIRDFVLTGHR